MTAADDLRVVRERLHAAIADVIRSGPNYRPDPNALLLAIEALIEAKLAARGVLPEWGLSKSSVRRCSHSGCVRDGVVVRRDKPYCSGHALELRD